MFGGNLDMFFIKNYNFGEISIFFLFLSAGCSL